MDLSQPARREVARARISMAASLGLQTHPEYARDRATLRHDSRALATADRLVLCSIRR